MSSDSSPTLHGLTVDVEDWFHILESDDAPPQDQWAQQESRVAYNTMRLLELFDRRAVKATFFCLGWVAERCPEIVQEIVRRGHDVGSHGHLHQLASALGRDGFARDLDQSLQALAAAGAGEVQAFRAPGFSIGIREAWAFEILHSRGIRIDASLFLSPRAHGGIALQRRRPFDIDLGDGRTVLEFPTVPQVFGKLQVPFAGGGYLRLWPEQVLAQFFAAADRARTPAIVYVHPREIDPNQPRMPLSPKRKFKYYVGLDTTLPKLDALLGRFRFASLRQMATQSPRDVAVAIRNEAFVA